MEPPFEFKEVWGALESMLTTYVTMGEKVKESERRFAEYVGTKHAVMVNSGSSANLLALAALTNGEIERPIPAGSEVITPAVTWATTVFPIVQNGLIPVLVDVLPDTFDIDPDAIERAITPKTAAIMVVHLLGNPCDMDRIKEIAKRHDLLIVEDSCESHGAQIRGQKTGSFGDVGTFSFYFSHHITTVEGGMLVTDRDDIADLTRILRVFGWTRGSVIEQELAASNSDIDPRYLFTNIGYNLRPTEIQGAFGIAQIKKLDSYIDMRRVNAEYWNDALNDLSDVLGAHAERPDTRHVWFGYPITLRQGGAEARNQLMSHLESRNVETRSIMSGNMARQPVMEHLPHRVSGNLANAQAISENSLMIGNHQGVGPAQREAIVHYLTEFATGFRPT